MSNKLVRKKKNKPKYGWMQDEIDALARKDARDRQLAGYGVTMANHALEIGFWVLHDKYGFGKKRLNRMMDCINAYLVAEYNEELSIRQLPLALQKMKVQVDVCAEAKKVPQRCRLKMAEMDRMNNPNEFKTRMHVITEALSVTYAMICTELVTREKMSGAKICEFMNECTAFINDYLDGGWVCQEDIRYQLEKETGVKVVLK